MQAQPGPAGAGVSLTSPRPRSVAYAQLLLRVQAAFWAYIAAATFAGMAVGVAGRQSPGQAIGFIVVGALVVALPAGMAVLSIRLARRLAPSGRRAWLAAIVLESLMTMFGLWSAYSAATSGGARPASVPVLVGLVGSVLSFACVVGLTSMPARRYFGRGGNARAG